MYLELVVNKLFDVTNTPGTRSIPRFLAPALLFGLLAVGLSADEGSTRPTVYVSPIVNATGETVLDPIAAAITSSLELNLSFLEDYEVVRDRDLEEAARLEDREAVTAEADAAAAAERTGADNVVFGLIELRDDRSIVLNVSVFAQSEGEVTITREENADSLVDVFAASDRAVVGLVGSFGGVALEFGAVELNPEGRQDLRWSVELDGEPVGDNISEIDTVLSGTRSLEITVEGEHRTSTVYSDDIDIRAGEVAEVSFLIPEVVPEDVELAEELQSTVEQSLVQPMNLPVAENAFLELRELVTAYPVGLEEAQQFLGEYPLRFDLAVKFGEMEAYAGNLIAGNSAGMQQLLNLAEETGERIDQAEPAAREAAAGDIVRLFDGLDALYRIELAAAMQTPDPDYEAVVEGYESFIELRRVAERHNVPGAHDSRIAAESGTRAAEAIVLRDARRTPVHHLLIGGTGAALTAGGGIMAFAGPADSLRDEADDLYTQYQESEDPVEISALREESESLYGQAAMWEIGQWTAIGVGAGALLYSAIARWRSTRAPELERDRLIDSRLATEASIAERIRAGEEATLLVRGYPPGDEATFSVDGRLASNIVLVDSRQSITIANVGAAISADDNLQLAAEQAPPIVVLDR